MSMTALVHAEAIYSSISTSSRIGILSSSIVTAEDGNKKKLEDRKITNRRKIEKKFKTFKVRGSNGPLPTSFNIDLSDCTRASRTCYRAKGQPLWHHSPSEFAPPIAWVPGGPYAETPRGGVLCH